MATKKPEVDVATTGSDRPPEPTGEEIALAQAGGDAAPASTSASLDRPTLEPPTTAAGATATAGAGWLTNKRVLMLYQRSVAMDGWAYLDGGTGWRRLVQNDGASRGIAELAACARASGALVHVYEGASGSLDGIYVW